MNTEERGSKPTVLLVDDEARVVDGLRVGLRKSPFEVVTTTEPERALEIVDRERVDVVVSDQQMPGLQGSQLLSVLASRHPRVMRVMLTGQACLDVALAAINKGEVHRFLVKPCNARELAVTLEQLLELRRLRSEREQLVRIAREQRRVLERLEQGHPGISQLVIDEDGDIVVEADGRPITELLRELEESAPAAAVR